ncbi:hypothetical protein [Rhizobium leguminosarum]|uniref:hypothetical protein n=1 Tax=Rhizobium leguminosarum TaxID=384 RepID=UPI001C90A1C3|nr:hypothetical protein [Rhizobium leguminosarum]MBY2919636.1 hypothetical protein [Rhizobium leguminosarum]MBY2975335.1 hypothetical protein [Rhizobium leguminosarum]MBY2981867.1 hypothetical protein [Rhizobium leguminosarum]MBY3011252.1 hypothetical protein [Rhizobium leguminosarum]
MLELDTLMKSVIDLLPRFESEARTLMKKLSPALRKHLKDKSIPMWGELPANSA